jgi:hypothetical protein
LRGLGVSLLLMSCVGGAVSLASARAGVERAPIVTGDPGVRAAESAGACVSSRVGSSVAVEEILSRYNDGIVRALAGIETLRVAQTVFEPQDDGGTKRACAILSYRRARGMTREETYTELVYPVGEYTLSSLVGPLLDPATYDVEYAGVEEAEGVSCHRLEVTAIPRDFRHFDGSVWISIEGFAPVRIVGRVADPPFPAVEVTLDKVFALGPHGLRLVRRHTGRGEFRILFITKRGERTIYYDDYEAEFAEPSDGAEEE